METQDINISDLTCFRLKSDDKALENFFSREKILKLLELYKVYRKRLGSYIVKNMKKLWEVIAREMSNEFKVTIPPNKCENKFKVLERNYKKVIENNSQSGRGRKFFEYEQEMDEIFEKKKNINPTTLLSSSSLVQNMTKDEDRNSENLVEVIELSIPENDDDPQPSCSYTQTQSENSQCSVPVQPAREQAVTPKNYLKRRRVQSPAYVKRNDILVEIKNDLKLFYKRKDERETEKLDIEKRKLADRENRTAIAREYLDIIKKDQDSS